MASCADRSDLAAFDELPRGRAGFENRMALARERWPSARSADWVLAADEAIIGKLVRDMALVTVTYRADARRSGPRGQRGGGLTQDERREAIEVLRDLGFAPGRAA